MTDYALDAIKDNQPCTTKDCGTLGAKQILYIDRDEHIVHWLCRNSHTNQTKVNQDETNTQEQNNKSD